MTATTPITIRLACTDDAVAIAALAQLDSSGRPTDPVLLAETGGDLVAAISLLDGTAVADPFRPTADVLELLRLRAARARLGDGREPRGLRFPAPLRRRARLASAH
jgi:hypothetical protein